MKIFDLCGTLYFSNTTFDFVRYVNPRLSKFIFSMPVRFLSRLISAFYNYDLLRSLSILSLRGLTEKQLSAMAEDFYDMKLASLKNDLVIGIMMECKDEAMIASASIDPIVKVVAGRLGVKSHISSKLEIIEGKCTGRLSWDALGKKSESLNGLDIELVVTDNKTDLDIIAVSEKAIIVSGDGDLQFWYKRIRKQDKILKV